MAKFEYKVIESVTEETYIQNTGKSVYDVLGKDLDLTKIILVVDANNEEDAAKIRMAVTDVRMWEKI